MNRSRASLEKRTLLSTLSRDFPFDHFFFFPLPPAMAAAIFCSFDFCCQPYHATFPSTIFSFSPCHQPWQQPFFALLTFVVNLITRLSLRPFFLFPLATSHGSSHFL